MDKSLVNKGGAAEMLSVSVRTIERMMAAGQLTKVKIRGAVRLRVSEIKAFLEGGAE